MSASQEHFYIHIHPPSPYNPPPLVKTPINHLGHLLVCVNTPWSDDWNPCHWQRFMRAHRVSYNSPLASPPVLQTASEKRSCTCIALYKPWVIPGKDVGVSRHYPSLNVVVKSIKRKHEYMVEADSYSTGNSQESFPKARKPPSVTTIQRFLFPRDSNNHMIPSGVFKQPRQRWPWSWVLQTSASWRFRLLRQWTAPAR